MNYAAALRKPGLIPFGSFNPADAAWLQVIIDMPGGGGGGSTTDTFATIPFSPSPVFDTNLASILSITLVAPVTSSTINFAGGTPPLGHNVELRIIQDAAGGWTFAFPSNLIVDPNFAIDPTPLNMTALPIFWNGVNWIFKNMAFSGPRP